MSIAKIETDGDTNEFDVKWREIAQDGINEATQKIQLLLARYSLSLPPRSQRLPLVVASDFIPVDALLARWKELEALAVGFNVAARKHRECFIENTSANNS